MKPTTLLSQGLLVLSVLVGGCALTVGPTAPRPNVMVHAGDAPAALVLGPGIEETYVIPGTGSIRTVNVTGWRTTLENGFHNAFPEGQSGRKLEILQAELSFSPRALRNGGTAAVSANVRFKARLLSSAGDELGILAGTAMARDVATKPSETTANAGKAVEAMYEILANELAAPKATIVEAPPPAPAKASAKAKSAKAR